MQRVNLLGKICSRALAVQLLRSQQHPYSLEGFCGHALPCQGHLQQGRIKPPPQNRTNGQIQLVNGKLVLDCLTPLQSALQYRVRERSQASPALPHQADVLDKLLTAYKSACSCQTRWRLLRQTKVHNQKTNAQIHSWHHEDALRHTAHSSCGY